jgi:ATP-dependent Clp protease ATP-binding subunit ClpB
MTSNIGSREIQGADANEQSIRARVMEQLRAAFKPEFLNRVDEVIIFKQLGLEQLRQIIKVQLESLRRLLLDRKVNLVLDPSAEELLATAGYDPVYGARPLKRAIQSLIQNPLAMKLLSGEIKAGETITVRGDQGRGQMIFTSGPSEAPPETAPPSSGDAARVR